MALIWEGSLHVAALWCSIVLLIEFTHHVVIVEFRVEAHELRLHSLSSLPVLCVEIDQHRVL